MRSNVTVKCAVRLHLNGSEAQFEMAHVPAKMTESAAFFKSGLHSLKAASQRGSQME